MNSNDALLIAQWYAEGLSTVAIGKRLGVSGVTIGHWLQRLGIARRHKGNMLKRLSATERDSIIARYQAGEWATPLAHEFGISQAAVSGLLKRRGIVTHKHGFPSRYECNHAFFAQIESEAHAYWLGFLTADGTITDRAVILILQARDAQHLERFRDAIGSTHPVRFIDNHGYPGAKIYVHSPAMVQDLAGYTVTPHKTKTIRFPDLPQPCIRHYIRGYVEGDGGFYTRMNHRHRRQHPSREWSFSVMGNRAFITTLQQYCMTYCGLNQVQLHHPPTHYPDAVSLRYGGGRQVLRLFRWLYDDATIYLPRKHAAFFPLPQEKL